MKRAAAEAALVALKQTEKRPRHDVVVGGVAGSKDGVLTRARTSQLEAPTMQLQGHKGEVFCVKFSPQGNILASAGFDKLVHVWNVYGNCANLHRLKGHENAILELHWSESGEHLYTCSADKSVAVWDVDSGARLKKIAAGSDIVNSVCPSRRGTPLLITGGDDSFAKLWDLRAPKRPTQSYEGPYPVLACCLSRTSDQVFVGDVSGEISVWDSRKQEVLYSLLGHTDRVTGLKLSPDGTHLLSNAADDAMRSWDVRPFVAGGDDARCTRVYSGHRHGIDQNLLRCTWSPDGGRVAGGSSDSPPHVYVWDAKSKSVEYRLPGHRAAVNEVDFHPSGNIIGSCSSDKTIYLGELQGE